jgi:tRNA threonylcarbamoyladenosine biosynthesis protein TsaB
VNVLGFDTATRSTAVAVCMTGGMTEGSTFQVRDDPAAGEHPGHATRLLGMADELLAEAGIGWSALDRITVGLGPGTFTGLRVGIATARGLAQSLGVELVGVSSLRALAEPALRSEPEGARVLAVLDARRGEAFAAAYGVVAGGAVEELASPRALAPEDLGALVEQATAEVDERVTARPGGEGDVPWRAARPGGEGDVPWRAVGDGAVRFRGQLQDAGVPVPPDSSPLHLLSARAICWLGAREETVAAGEAILPDYCRRPDAEIALERAR